jgi:hypothetical protein
MPVLRALAALNTTLRVSLISWLAPGAAHAAQGPGVVPGTAGSLLETAMAVVVYGSCVATVMVAMVLKVTRRR